MLFPLYHIIWLIITILLVLVTSISECITREPDQAVEMCGNYLQVIPGMPGIVLCGPFLLVNESIAYQPIQLPLLPAPPILAL